MEKKDKIRLCYVFVILLFLVPLMIHRYVIKVPTPLHILLMLAGALFLLGGLKLSGKKIDWNFDFSPSRKQRKR